MPLALLVVSALLAALLAEPILAALRGAGATARNYRGKLLPLPLGLLVVAGALATMALAALLALGGLRQRGGEAALPACACVVGCALLGLVDDTWGSSGAAVRGLRAHARALMHGQLTTGCLKAAGVPAVALCALALAGIGPQAGGAGAAGRWLLAGAVIALAVHVANILDVRPGRAAKSLLLLLLVLELKGGADRALRALAPFAGAALAAGAYDIRERGMLGDTGAAALGALGGWWLILSLGVVGRSLALALLVALTVYGEFRSITIALERVPLLRGLDSWGRVS